MNKIDKLLTLFCYDEAPACDREWMRKPMLHEGHVYATNAEVMLKVPVALCDEQYAPANPPEGKKPFEVIATNFKRLASPMPLPIESITEVLSRIEKVPGKKTCPICKGAGEVEDAEFIERNELTDGLVGCLECDGYGTVKDTETLVYPNHYHAAIKLSKTYLAVPYVSLLEKVCKAMGSDTATITAVWKFISYSSLMFQIGEATVIIVSLAGLDGEGVPVATIYEMNLPALTPVNH